MTTTPAPPALAKPRRASSRRRLVVPDDLLATLTDGVLVLTPTGRVQQANPAALGLVGAALGIGTVEDFVGLDARTLLADAGALNAQGRALSPDRDPVCACLATGLATSVRVQLSGDTGSPWLTVQVRPVRSGRSAATVDPSRDLVDALVVTLTASGRTDEATLAQLRDRDHQLSVAQRMAQLSMWRWDTATGNVEWLDGEDRETGIGGHTRTMDEYLNGIHPDDRPLHDQLLLGLLGGEPSGELDLRYRDVDGGGWRHWYLWAESVVDASGRVTALWGTTQEVTARREAEAAVRRLSMTDSLTELANRAQVVEQLTAAVRARQGLDGVGFVIVDIDRFSHVNDRYGPSAGDLLLIEVGRRLRGLGSVGLTAGRLGADQFGLVLDRADASSVTAVAHEAMRELSRPFTIQGVGEDVTVTVSVGTVMSTTGVSQTAGELVRSAEIALSYARAAGGGRVVMFDDVLRTEVGERVDMEGRLRSALGQGDVFAMFQPVFTLGGDRTLDRVTSCEALARMTGPSGLISPADFIPVAEETGMIIDVDLAMVAGAAAQLLGAPPVPGLKVAVNFSPLSLQVPGLLDRVTGVLGHYGLDARALRVEITESCLAEPTPVLLNHLNGLREMGATLGLDDFCTGYSALAYLSRFDLDFIKIDRSFVTDISADARARAVVRAVVDLAHAHDLTVVAEGVETAAQLETLRGMRCDMVQGFHLGRPMSALALGDLARG